MLPAMILHKLQQPVERAHRSNCIIHKCLFLCTSCSGGEAMVAWVQLDAFIPVGRCFPVMRHAAGLGLHARAVHSA